MAEWVPVIAAVGAVIVSMMPWIVRWSRQRSIRAGQTGSIGTSDASTLWKSSMDIIDRLQKDNDKLVSQRDRLIGLMDERIAPALEAIAATQRRDGQVIASIVTLLEGGEHEAMAPAPPDGS